MYKEYQGICLQFVWVHSKRLLWSKMWEKCLEPLSWPSLMNVAWYGAVEDCCPPPSRPSPALDRRRSFDPYPFMSVKDSKKGYVCLCNHRGKPTQGLFSRCSWAFCCFTLSSSADGVFNVFTAQISIFHVHNRVGNLEPPHNSIPRSIRFILMNTIFYFIISLWLSAVIKHCIFVMIHDFKKIIIYSHYLLCINT